MKRAAVILALGAALSMLTGVVTASPAFARGPQWQFADAGPQTLDPSYCGFEVGVTFPVDQTYFKELKTPDGSDTFLSTGLQRVTLTNLVTGKSVTVDNGGPFKASFSDDGTFSIAENGHGLFTLAPADAQRLGLPTLGLAIGGLQESIAPDGTVTSMSLNGHVPVDLCAALS